MTDQLSTPAPLPDIVEVLDKHEDDKYAPKEACVFCRAKAEIESLRSQLDKAMHTKMGVLWDEWTDDIRRRDEAEAEVESLQSQLAKLKKPNVATVLAFEAGLMEGEDNEQRRTEARLTHLERVADAARKLQLSLPDVALEQAEPAWGVTNTHLARIRRDALAATFNQEAPDED